ncbi:hypothetical protein LX36DRAFT_457375 [Colletotrichum falcatum]|nr:hypothetical protein LX36DRAFT_457375 [Colletotrichum falcatum]
MKKDGGPENHSLCLAAFLNCNGQSSPKNQCKHGSSGVERWAHNPEVPGSKPGRATIYKFCFLLMASFWPSGHGVYLDGVLEYSF